MPASKADTGDGAESEQLRAKLLAANDELRTSRNELDMVRRSEELTSMMVYEPGGFLTQTQTMKTELMHLQQALTDAGVPTKRKSRNDSAVPFYYSAGGSYTSWNFVPWLPSEKAPLTPAQGVEWLAEKFGKRRG